MERITELKIANNKIDRIEWISISNSVAKLTLKGNHILEIPSPKAMSGLKVREVRIMSKIWVKSQKRVSKP